MRRLDGIPGYVDLQVNGIKGVDYSSEELSADAFVFSCKELKKNSTIGFLPTIITSPDSLLMRNLGIMSSCLRFKEVSRMVLGFHLEGPFISREDGARGAHSLRWVADNNLSWLAKVRKASGGRVRMVTVSAEQKGIAGFIRSARRDGIIVSLGHQLADEGQIGLAVKAGASSLTHLGNGLPQNIHRFENPLWPSLAEDRLKAMIIPDGWHLPEALVKVIIRVKGMDNVIAVSDASPLALMPPGDYRALGNKVRIDRRGKLFNPDTGYLVGSWSTLRQCVEWMRGLDFLDGSDIAKLVYHNPLKLLGIKKLPLAD